MAAEIVSLETLCCVWVVRHEVTPDKVEGGVAVPVLVADHVEAVRRWAVGRVEDEFMYLPTPPLLLAVSEGSIEGLQFCWSEIAVEDRLKKGEDALDYAGQHGYLPVVQWLVEKCGTGENKALRGSAARGHLAVVQWLVEEGGADVHDGYDGTLWSTSSAMVWSSGAVEQYLMEKSRAKRRKQ